jgi:DNA-binding FadR family transcriptional regulator
VFEQLGAAIVRGEYEANSALPTEHELTDACAVSRQVVREAIRRLEQVGLVTTGQGGRTRVRDFRRTGGLDVLTMLSAYPRDSEELVRLWRGVLQMRAAITADIARLCAEHATQALGRELLRVRDEVAAASDARLRVELTLAFWDRVIDGCGNPVYRLAYNNLLAAGDDPRALERLVDAELGVSDCFAQIADAIAAGDAQAAERETRAMTAAGLADFERRVKSARRRRTHSG